MTVGTEQRPRRAAAAPPGPARRLALALVVAAGLPAAGAIYAQAYILARQGSSHVHEVFWAGTALALASAGGVLLLSRARRATAFWLVCALGALFFVPKLLRAPHYFDYYDELAHWRSVQMLLSGHGLFLENPLNKVVAFYPGLHVLTAAVATLTGWSVYAAGNAVILTAHVLACGAIYLLAERLLGRPLTAFLAALVFVATPAFFYFDAQFAYESLALPLVVVVVLIAVRLLEDTGPDRNVLFGCALALVFGVVVTHHSSSYAMLGILALITGVAVALRRTLAPRAWLPLLALTTAGAIAALAWLFGEARYTLHYLGPYLTSNLASLPSFFRGKQQARSLFAGARLPSYEIYGSYLSVLVLAILFVAGVRLLWKRRGRWPAAGLGIAAVLGSLYFLSLPFVVLRSDQVAKRSWAFAFIGLAPVCAVALSALGRRAGRLGAPVVGTLLLVVFVGGVVTFSGDQIRFPGPYQPSADPRSFTPGVVAAATWMQREQGPANRVMGDRSVAAVMGSYGQQFPVIYSYYGNRVWDVFQPISLIPTVFAELDRSRTGWVAVDERASTAPPLAGYYFADKEPGAFTKRVLARAALDKFDAPHFERLYDGGDVVVYRYDR